MLIILCFAPLNQEPVGHSELKKKKKKKTQTNIDVAKISLANEISFRFGSDFFGVVFITNSI